MNLDECKSQIMELAKGININNLKNEHIDSIQIPIPSDFQQIVFCDYVHTCDKLKFEAQERLGELNTAREGLIDKYFR